MCPSIPSFRAGSHQPSPYHQCCPVLRHPACQHPLPHPGRQSAQETVQQVWVGVCCMICLMFFFRKECIVSFLSIRDKLSVFNGFEKPVASFCFPLSEFCGDNLSRYRFTRALTKLNTNILHLCFSQVSLLSPAHIYNFLASFMPSKGIKFSLK